MAYSGTCTHSYWSSWGFPSWSDRPVFHWLVILIGLTNSLSTSTFSEMIKIRMCMYSSLASHTLRREEGSGHTATIELSPQQKLDVTNQIHTVDRIRCHGVQSCRVLSRCLTAVFDNCIPRQQLDGCSVTRLFLSMRRVWLVRRHVFLTKEVNSFVSNNRQILILPSFIL